MSIDEPLPLDGQTTQSFLCGVELSEEELDQVAGGLNLYFSAGSFRENAAIRPYQSSHRSRFSSRQPGFQTRDTRSNGFQLIISDASTEDLKLLSGIFSSLREFIDS
ncbi:MAG: hypothetical protein ACKO24_01720 [Leptolyngbyaceae cyanobacterium]